MRRKTLYWKTEKENSQMEVRDRNENKRSQRLYKKTV